MNAFTASKHTNYYFDVNVDSFEEALDRYMATSLFFLINCLRNFCKTSAAVLFS